MFSHEREKKKIKDPEIQSSSHHHRRRQHFDSFLLLKCFGFYPQVENKCVEEVNVLNCRVIKLHNLLTGVISYKKLKPHQ